MLARERRKSRSLGPEIAQHAGSARSGNPFRTVVVRFPVWALFGRSGLFEWDVWVRVGTLGQERQVFRRATSCHWRTSLGDWGSRVQISALRPSKRFKILVFL